MVGAYHHKGKKEASAGTSAEVAELRAMLEQAQRQIRTLARETGTMAQVEHAAAPLDVDSAARMRTPLRNAHSLEEQLRAARFQRAALARVDGAQGRCVLDVHVS